MFSQLFENPSNIINMILFISINPNIILIYNNKDIEIFDQDLINIVLKTFYCVKQVK